MAISAISHIVCLSIRAAVGFDVELIIINFDFSDIAFFKSAGSSLKPLLSLTVIGMGTPPEDPQTLPLDDIAYTHHPKLLLQRL